MLDNVVINKAEIIQRYAARARGIYAEHKNNFATDLSPQDAAVMNIQRACEAAIGLGHHLIKRDRLGVQQSAKDVFVKLNQAGYIDNRLSELLQGMVGFCNISRHQYQELKLSFVIKIIEEGLDDLLDYSEIMLREHNQMDYPTIR